MQFLIAFLVTLSIASRAFAQDISCPPGQLSVSVEFGTTQCADIPICVEGWPDGNCPPDSFCGLVRTGIHGCRLKNVLPPTEAPTTTETPTNATTTVIPTNATTTVVPTNATTTEVPTNATTTVTPTNATTTVVPTNSTTTVVPTNATTAPTTSGSARLRKLFGLF